MRSVLRLIVLIAALAAVPARAEVESPGKGSPVRTAILDALRLMVEGEVGKPVEFVVTDLRVLGEWAFVVIEPQRPGGKPIEYIYSRYQSWVDNGAFDGQAIALLRETPKGWLVYEYSLGATDVVWSEWGKRYPVPPEVFPGN